MQAVLKPKNLRLSAAKFRIGTNETINGMIKEAMANHELGQSVLKALKEKAKRHPKVALADCEEHDGLLLIEGLCYVPEVDPVRLEILRSTHDSPATGHPGQARTFELVSRNYWWPGMRKYIARYVDHCHTCARSKPVRHAPFGKLRPLEVPPRPWESVSMDFVVGLPESEEVNAILVVVDRLTKMAHYIPTHDTATAEDVAKLYLENVWKLHGLPSDIISDRGPQFISIFWKSLCAQLTIT